MAEITASMVKDLREATGAGMMDCKKALVECAGDVEAAKDWLRQKGLAKAASKSDREAKEGLIRIRKTDDRHGSMLLLAVLSTLFITTNLSIGYTFSTLAQNQLQAVQMAMMFFLPNLLLSGFLFPFAGMPQWAQYIGECLPLTHFVRIVRAIMLKGSTITDLRYDALALAALMLVAMTIAVTRFRRTLD